jgi:hypothetical protein
MLHSRAAVLSGLDAAVVAWRIAVGAVSSQRLQLISDFIAAEKASGAWDLTDDYWVLWGENETQALTSLKQRRVATAVNSPTFTASRGYAFNGTTNYINSGCVPSTAKVAMTGTNVRIGFYERTDLASTTAVSVGVGGGGSSIFQGISRSAGNFVLSRLNGNAAIGYTLPVVTGLGYTAVSRNGNTVDDNVAYKNGVALVFASGTPTFIGVLPTNAIYIGAHDNFGTASSFRATSMGLVCVGASLSAAQELAQYTAVQAFATAIGAQV